MCRQGKGLKSVCVEKPTQPVLIGIGGHNFRLDQISDECVKLTDGRVRVIRLASDEIVRMGGTLFG